jgi:hypothetical protein
VSRQIALVNGVNPSMLTPVSDRDKRRATREESAAQAQATEQLLAGAGALGQNLGKAPEPGSPLESVMSGMGV